MSETNTVRNARDVLCQIIAEYGPPVAVDLKRLKGLFDDLCGNRSGENTLLLNAAQQGVPVKLMSPAVAPQPAELLLSRLTLHLEEHLLVSQPVARWAVESWALALGRITSDDLTTQELNVKRATTPEKEEVPASTPDQAIIKPDINQDVNEEGADASDPELIDVPRDAQNHALDSESPSADTPNIVSPSRIRNRPRRKLALWAAASIIISVIIGVTFGWQFYERKLHASPAYLQNAIHANSLQDISVAIRAGADVNGNLPKNDEPALIYAIFQPQVQIGTIKFLVDNGSNIDGASYIGDNGVTDTYNPPLYAAIESNRNDVVKYLLDKGADVNVHDPIQYSDETPLMIAADKGDEDAVKLLLTKGADVGAKDDLGQTAEDYAESSRELAVGIDKKPFTSIILDLKAAASPNKSHAQK